jgi:hypothetical protein
MRMTSSRRTRSGSFNGRGASFAAAYGVGYSSRELRERSQAAARAAAVAGSSPPKEVVAELGLQRSSSLSDLQHSSGGTVMGSDSLQQPQAAQGMLPVYPMRKSRSSEWEPDEITEAEALLWQP